MFGKVRSRLATALYPRFFRPAGVRIGQGVRLHGWPLFVCTPGAQIVVGDKAVLCSEPAMTALGVRQPVIFRTLTAKASIQVGKDCGLSGTTCVAAQSIMIGEGCMLGAHVMIFDTDFHNVHSADRRYERVDWDAVSRPVRIGNNVFVGTSSIICKGVEIGDNAVIGAGSVVTRSIPGNAIAAGNPCRVVGEVKIGNHDHERLA